MERAEERMILQEQRPFGGPHTFKPRFEGKIFSVMPDKGVAAEDF